MKEKKFKRCPRCNEKTPIFQDRCDGCGLIFSRLSKASNRAAKVCIKKRQHNKVIMDKVLPKDVSKWKLFFWGLFLGFFGVHYAKVGRYKMFAWGVVSAASLYIVEFLPMSWFNHEYLFLVMWGLLLPAALYFICFVVSIFQIAFNKFKVPISIDEEYVKDSLDKEIVDNILKEVKESKEEKSSGQDGKQAQKESNKKLKKEKIRVVCASCGAVVKVFKEEKYCPKCDEPLKDD